MKSTLCISILFICISCICTVNNNVNVDENETRFSVQVEYAEFDCGVIDDTTKTISHTYHFFNDTDETCLITRIIPSCGCTSVDCSKKIIPPKGETSIHIDIDIDALYNDIYKTVSIYTSISDTPIIASIRAFKRMPQSMIHSQFPYKLGDNMRVSAKQAYLGFVQHGQKVSRKINVINVSNKNIELKSSLNRTSDNLVSCYVPNKLDSGEISVIVITYDASNAYNIWGEQSCDIVVCDNDTCEMIHASGVITEKIVRKRGDNPKITVSFPPETYTAEDAKTWCYTLTNSGKNKLLIKNIQCSLVGVETSITSQELVHNQSAQLRVSVPLPQLATTNFIDLGISSNDPIEPYKLLRIPFQDCFPYN